RHRGRMAWLAPLSDMTPAHNNRLSFAYIEPLRRRVQLFSASLMALAGKKASLLEAAILMASPVAGLRPLRSALCLTLNLPKPGIDVSAPDWAASAICAKTLSTMLLACVF